MISLSIRHLPSAFCVGNGSAHQQGRWIFPNPCSLNPYWASEVLKDDLIPAGKKAWVLNLGWHSFRHTYRSFLDATGAPIGAQQKLMRHSHVSTTMNIYGNAQMDSKREAQGKVVRMVLKWVV